MAETMPPPSDKQALQMVLTPVSIPLDTLKSIIFGTTVARHIAITDPYLLPAATASRIWDNVQAWRICGDWPDRRRTAAEIDAELGRQS